MATTRSAEKLADSIKATGLKIDYYKEHALARRLQIMKRAGISLVLDVGANVGQYAKIARKAGYKGQIVSFEPLGQAFSKLARFTFMKASRRSASWRLLEPARMLKGCTALAPG